VTDFSDMARGIIESNRYMVLGTAKRSRRSSAGDDRSRCVRTADGSALYAQGETRIICTASVTTSVPRWMD